MDPVVLLIIGLAVIAILMLAVLVVSLICFKMAFYSKKRVPITEGYYDVPDGPEYQAFTETFHAWQDATRKMSCVPVEIKSYDGLTLKGRFYEFSPDAPIEIMFHGYRGSSDRDLCGGVQRCFKLGHSTLIVDHRAHGESDGHVITFGYKERIDCLDWINFTINRFGKDRKIILTGISMGAATVLMASGEDLPQNVVGIIEDCGFTSAKEMILKSLKEMHLPPKPMYPIVRLGGMLWGNFDPDLATPLEAVKKARVPIIFIHGDADAFIPKTMCDRMYEACPAPKMQYIVKGAGHGLAYPQDEEEYFKAINEFKKMLDL